MKVGEQVWFSGESTHLVLLLFGRQHPENGPLTNSKRCFSAKIMSRSAVILLQIVVGPGTHLVQNHESQPEPKSP